MKKNTKDKNYIQIVTYIIICFIFIISFIFRDYIYDVIGVLKYNDKYAKQSSEVEVLKSENKALKDKIKTTYELNSLKFEDKYKYQLSEVTIRNPYSFFDTLIINEGKKSNIKNGYPVVSENGLIGVISEVNSNSSKVDLITNATNEISVIVHGSYGILSGYSKKDNNLIIKNITNYDNIEIGDLVYTSGLGKLPLGILIGKVEKIVYDRFKIEQSIYVKSKVDLNNINYVAVILSGEPK